jgi:hypothetical protein
MARRRPPSVAGSRGPEIQENRQRAKSDFPYPMVRGVLRSGGRSGWR